MTLRLAVLLSVLLHELTVAGWEHREALAGFSLFRPILKNFATAAQPAVPKPESPTITFIEQPVVERPKPREDRRFVETDANQPTGDAPQDARFYSDRSTAAANPNNPTDKTGATPYLEGKDTRLISTENVIPKPGAPAAPPPRPAAPPQPAAPTKPVAPPQPATPKAAEPLKQLADEGVKVVEETKVALLEKPVEPTPPRQPAAPVEPPPTPGAGSHREIASLKTKMIASGVSRIGVAAFNVEGNAFGAYDKALIQAVQSRWYRLIDQNGLYERSGQVTLHFYLRADGSVTDETGQPKTEVKENTAGEILGLFCEKAVLESAPFAPLSDKLRALIGDDPREISFTFYY